MHLTGLPISFCTWLWCPLFTTTCLKFQWPGVAFRAKPKLSPRPAGHFLILPCLTTSSLLATWNPFPEWNGCPSHFGLNFLNFFFSWCSAQLMLLWSFFSQCPSNLIRVRKRGRRKKGKDVSHGFDGSILKVDTSFRDLIQRTLHADVDSLGSILVICTQTAPQLLLMHSSIKMTLTAWVRSLGARRNWPVCLWGSVPLTWKSTFSIVLGVQTT